MPGAEKLLGKGDMLFLSGDSAKPRRIQGALVTEGEVHDVVKFLKAQGDEMVEKNPATAGVPPSLQVDFNAAAAARQADDDGADDDMYAEAKEVVIHAGKASASLLQRRLRVGYARAARLLDILEEKGVIGPGDGAKPRDVYIKPDAPIQETVLVESQDFPSIPRPDIAATIVNSDTPEAEQDEN